MIQMTHTAQTSKPLATQSSASNSAKGERRVQILQMLAQMLEHPEGEKITTAGLAKRLEVSEAALYRHFASKAQMFEGLIEFIETSVVGLLAQINQSDANAMQKIQKSLHVLLAFAQKNPGMARVLIGDALLHENPRLQARVTQLIDRVQASLKQSFRDVAMETGWQPVVEVGVYSEFWMSWVVGRWHAYVRSGFKVVPTEHLEATWTAMNIF
mgnify:CR=1 FL=1|jgi:TetR/AcrR family transcriptional regulator